ncbi:Uncharacterised protein [Megamonas hypermegale]|uniref:Uncharacterized protein n=1 Tax=Megamonas hypermegale TaxID=158847 RepID=A0A378NQ98_9FIRM|nr:Uncharacterised protein [Megamonas hypermegale]
MGKMLTRQEAWELLTKYTKTPNLPNASVKPLNLFMEI